MYSLQLRSEKMWGLAQGPQTSDSAWAVVAPLACPRGCDDDATMMLEETAPVEFRLN